MASVASIPFNPELKDVSRGGEIVGLSVAFIVLTVSTTGSRVGMKLWDKARLATDDVFILFALALNLLCNIVDIVQVHYGFGRHLQFLDEKQARKVVMLSQLLIIFATLAIWAVKISISFFILRLIQGTHRHLRWATYFLITLTTVSTLIQGILWGLQARPLKKLWEPETPGTVASTDLLINAIYFNTAIIAITDFFYALSPVYFLARVQMSTKRKAIVMALTGSGLLVLACSLVRTAFQKEFFAPDSSWALRNVWIATIFERNGANVIADLPAIFTLVQKFHRRLTTRSSRGRKSTNKNDSSGTTASEEHFDLQHNHAGRPPLPRQSTDLERKYNVDLCRLESGDTELAVNDSRKIIGNSQVQDHGRTQMEKSWLDAPSRPPRVPLKDPLPLSFPEPPLNVVVQTDIDIASRRQGSTSQERAERRKTTTAVAAGWPSERLERRPVGF